MVTERQPYPLPHQEGRSYLQEKPWRGSTLYQLYMPSFKDSNGDGIGDLDGVREKLPYLRDLGVDALLMPPLYPSLVIETGYAVNDYTSVDPRYGSEKECEKFIDEAHDVGMRVIFDLVMNHSSNEHPWFIESSSSKDNSKSDWYIWKDPKKDGSPPSNLVANFGGLAWEYNLQRQQYYYHTFLKEQPDLNYRNPEVISAMTDVMRYWFEKGVDGMRLDSLPFIFKHPDLPDEEENPLYREGVDHPFQRLKHEHIWYQPEMLDVLEHFNEVATSEFSNKFIVSEAYPPLNADKKWINNIYHRASKDHHAILNSGTIGVPWNAKGFSEFVSEYYDRLNPSYIPMWVLDSHDEYQRVINRLGEDQARVAAMWQLTTPSSMPVIYYGDEIGIKSWPVRPDTNTNVFHFVNPDSTRTKEPVRLPLPWDDSKNGGFTTGEPWLPLPQDYGENNVQSNLSDENSLFHLYKKLLNHRRSSEAVQSGSYHQVDSKNEQVFSYECFTQSEQEVVLLNFSSDSQDVVLPYEKINIVLSTSALDRNVDITENRFRLLPNEGIIFTVENLLDNTSTQQ